MVLHGVVDSVQILPVAAAAIASAASAVAAAAMVASYIGSAFVKVVWAIIAAGHSGRQHCSI